MSSLCEIATVGKEKITTKRKPLTDKQKEMKREYDRIYRRKHNPEIRKRERIYGQKHAESISSVKKIWRDKNQAIIMRWRMENKARIAVDRKLKTALPSISE